MATESIEQAVKNAIMSLGSDDEKIELTNRIKEAIHEVSPLKGEPIDCVLWIRSDLVQANAGPWTIHHPKRLKCRGGCNAR